jgi:O-antigen ligase
VAGVPRVHLAGVAALLFGFWVILVVVVLLERPGYLLEAAAIGLAGVVATTLWSRWPSPTLPAVAIGVVAFTVPLLNTLPARVYGLKSGSAVLGWRDLFAPATLLIAGLAVVVWRTKGTRPVPRLPAIGAALLCIGGLAAAVGARSVDTSLGAWLSGIVVPAVAGLLVARTRLNRLDTWRILCTLLCAATVPMTMAIASYFLEFGFPTSGESLVVARQELYRPFLMQQASLGNISHLADLALLLLPVAAIAAAAAPTLLLRAIGVVTIALTTLCLLLTLVRSAIMIAVIALVVVVAAAAVRNVSRRRVLPALIALTLVIVVSSVGPVRGYFLSLTTPTATATTPSSGASEHVRLAAIHRAIDIFDAHAPLGVGPGEFQSYDPVHTSAHSLALQTLAEDGVIGAAGLFVILLALLLRLPALVRRAPGAAAISWPARAAGIGAVFFVAEALVNGSLLAVGSVGIWGLVLWIEIAIATAEVET